MLEQDSRGTILRSSPEAERIFRIHPRDLRGAKLTDLVNPRAHPAVLAAFSRAAKQGEASVLVPLRRGARFPMGRIRIRREGQAGFITRLTAMHPEASRPSAPEGESAGPDRDRLANVSHEIRTPLNAVIGFADALRQESFGPLGDRRYRDYAKLIQESGQHVLALVNDLLDLSKAEANKITVEPQAVSVPELINSCVAMMRLEADRAGLDLRVEFGRGVGVLRVDPKIVRQVLLNLLSNALKFTERGSITVRCRLLDGRLAVSVSDTGVGMTQNDLRRVGERFYQARESGVRGARGSGLGLALSRALATAHGGRLDISSEPGHGTTATFSVPVAGSDSPRRYRRLDGDTRRSVLAFPPQDRQAS